MGAVRGATKRRRQPESDESGAVLAPLEGDSLAGWINAVAEQQGKELKTLLREFHVRKLGTLSMAEIRLSEPVARRIAKLTGVDESTLHAMTLARYAGNALPHLPLTPWVDGAALSQWSKGAWFHGALARWCPQCLRANDRRWPLRWKLPWSFACVEHGKFLVSACQACQANVYSDLDGVPPARCGSRVEDRLYRYGIDERCGFPLPMCRAVPVTDEAVLTLQRRVNDWLEGTPAQDDRQLVSLAAVLIPLVSPSMLRRGDPVVLYALRSTHAPAARWDGALWTDPLRVAAAVCAAGHMLRRPRSAAGIAGEIADLRIIDQRHVPWRMDVLQWAYGPALRPNPIIDELVRLQVVIPRGSECL
ncbi:TniQ family protein [Streptomyces sp. NPDC101165]|uniref:TniQ family protein n=1 Tax=Streptomyces sp. NPDC101165 TaxID=3366119 RepID=UPI0037F4C14B